MKKLKLLFIPLVGLAAFMGVWLSGTNNVSAANNDACQATWFRDNIVQKVAINLDGNNVTLTNNSGFNLDYKFIPDGNEGNSTTGRINNGASINLSVTNGGAVFFYLVEDINDSCKAEAGTEVGIAQINASGLVANPLYNDSICVNYRNKWGNNEVMKNAVPYCYSAETYSIYSREQVQEWIDTAEELYEAINSSNGNQDITIDSSYQEVKDVTKTDKLVCNAFSDNNYETMHKYYHVETETVDNCAVTCKEEIEVNFSDPVATQPGMCFQYLIEIKSKVVCDGNYTAPPPTRKQVCYPRPQCISGSYVGDVGGPNEEFDSCVQECDGGKYTQKCIDSCYSKVYENDNKSTKISTNNKFTKKEVIALSPFYNPSDNFYEARQMANSCPSDAQSLYAQKQKNPGGYYSGGSWINTDYPSGSLCSLGPYYFSSLAQTQRTIDLNNKSLSYSGIYGGYFPDSNGILRENYGSTYCDDTCYWVGSCGSDTVLTETLAQEQYEKDVEEYMSKKQACEQKAATCTNETTDYEIVVDNLDTNDSKDDEDKSDWQEEFTSSQKLNSTTVEGDFPSMVILTDGSCEDGEDDPWHYHNIITFPGTWINNKTGQTVHSIQPGHEDFYTYVGNQYCTKLNSVPVNTAWYDWKVNQNGDPSALTDSEKKQIEENLDMNIRGHIDNYGYFGWDFDISCFYAVDTPTDDTEDCSPDNPDWPDCDPDNPSGGTDNNNETPVNSYDYRIVALDNLFPNSVTPTSSGDISKNTRASKLINEVESLRNNNATTIADTTREVGFNWTCAATNLENPDYIVQPVSLINQIQTLGDSIYEGDEYLDYHIRLTPETMNKVRAYNKKYKNNYTEPTSGDEILNAGNKKTSGITVYRSYLLHEVLNSNELLKAGLIGCNNEGKGENECNNTIDTSTACYNEYMAQSSVLKGAK